MPDAQPSTSPGHVGRYRVLELLGEGGMASVYRAEIQGMGGFSKIVALKLVHPHLASRPEFTRMFISEARLGGLLSHPNIVETHDVGEQDGRLFLAMEYVDGPTLEEVLRAHRRASRPIPLDIALEVILQVCQALDYAHRAADRDGRPLQMVHRDLKPSNLLFSRHGLVKLADFGVARASSNLLETRHTGTLKGTCLYMSPEQAWGRRDLDHRSDLFATGILLYELLTLEHLYEGANDGVIVRRAQDAAVAPRLEHLPTGPLRTPLQTFLTRALAARPEHRFPAGGEMARELERMLERIPTRTPLKRWLEALGPGAEPVPAGPTSLRGSLEAPYPSTIYEPTHTLAGELTRVAASSPFSDTIPDAPGEPRTITATIGSLSPSGPATPAASAQQAYAAVPGHPGTTAPAPLRTAPSDPPAYQAPSTTAPRHPQAPARPTTGTAPRAHGTTPGPGAPPRQAPPPPRATPRDSQVRTSAGSRIVRDPIPSSQRRWGRLAAGLVAAVAGAAVIWYLGDFAPRSPDRASPEAGGGTRHEEPAARILASTTRGPAPGGSDVRSAGVDEASSMLRQDTKGNAARPPASGTISAGGGAQTGAKPGTPTGTKPGAQTGAKPGAQTGTKTSAPTGAKPGASKTETQKSTGTSRPASPAAPGIAGQRSGTGAGADRGREAAQARLQAPASTGASSASTPAAGRDAQPPGPASVRPTGSAPPGGGGSAAGGSGTLVLNAKPVAAISLDGEVLRECPVSRQAVRAGTHTLVFEGRDGQRQSREILLKAGATMRCTAFFKEGQRIECLEE